MKSKHYNRIATALLLIAGIMSTGNGCDAIIFEDMLDCPQGVYLKFYSKTPCDTDSIYSTDVRNLSVFVFDGNNRFVAEYTEENVTLSSSYEMLIPIYPHGKYSFVAWANLNESFEMQPYTRGVSTKEDILFRLHSKSNVADDLTGMSLFTGSSNYVFLPDPESIQGAFYEHEAINLWEYTNRIEVIVEGFSNPEDYQIDIDVCNQYCAFGGDVALNHEHVFYPCNTCYDNQVLSSKFTTLKLETGHDGWLTLRSRGIDGKVLYHEDLLGTLLLQNPWVNLSCHHDFVVRFVVEEHNDSYVVTEVWVNDWLIHTYDTEIDSDY